MKNLKFLLLPLLFVGQAFAQAPRQMGPFPDGAAAPSQRREEVRQAIGAQRSVREVGVTSESRLSPEALAAMRQQIRQQGKSRREVDKQP